MLKACAQSTDRVTQSSLFPYVRYSSHIRSPIVTAIVTANTILIVTGLVQVQRCIVLTNMQ